MFPTIKHEPFKRVNLLLNTGNLFNDDRRFANLILKDKLSDYIYNDTEEFEKTVLSFTPEQREDLLKAMQVFNQYIINIEFETYTYQYKKNKTQFWSNKKRTIFVDYIATVKESIYYPNTYIDLLSYRPIGLWFEKMVNLIAGNTIEYHEFERGLINSRTIQLIENEHCLPNGGHTVCDLLAYLTDKYNCAIYLFSDCDSNRNHLVSAFKDYFDPSNFVPICFEEHSFVGNNSLRNSGTVQEFEWKYQDTKSDDDYKTSYLVDGNYVILSDAYEDDDINT